MQIGINDIIKILPHSYPLLLVDRVLDCDYGKSIKAIKNITFNEPFFIGHFPNHPIMPGVLIVEAFAQAAALCMYDQTKKDAIPYLVSIESAKFRKPVVPGDTLLLQVDVKNVRLKICKFECVACVSKERVAEATISAMLQTL